MAKEPKYYWWHGRDLGAFVAELMNKGLDNVRIEFHPQGRKGDGKAMLYVRSRDVAIALHDGDDDDGHNFAHPCPGSPGCE